MKILVGYDGSECAESGLHGLDVLLADPMPSLSQPPIETQETGSFQAMMETARGVAKKGADRLRQLFPSWQIHNKALCGSSYWGLIRAAESWGADLMVVGSHGRSAMSRAIFGSVSHFVINHAPCSVRVARCRGDKLEGPIRVLLGFDNSADSQLALRSLKHRSWPPGTEVRVIAVVDVASLYITAPYEYPAGHWSAEMEKELRNALHQAVDAAAEEIRQTGLAVTAEVKDGDPKQILLDEAENWPADCIFLGARGHSMLERFLIGSVSVAIATRAHCSAELVRPKRLAEKKDQ
jgi:nucleotide-binding universal stress UspA family protein